MRIFSIGDIHGRQDLLKNLLSILKKHHKLNLSVDKLIFMGDYIDRGPDSYLVLQSIKSLTEKHPNNVVALLGNHEQMMLDFLEGQDKWGIWFSNGGHATIHSFGNNSFDPMVEWLSKLPYSHQEPGFFFSHAPVPPEIDRAPRNKFKPFTREELIWTFHKDEKDGARKHENAIGVCGHVHALFQGLYEPRIYDHYIFTDAGCGCHPKAPLCAVEVVSKQIIYSIYCK